jgi:hypothetical protein
MSNCLRCGPGGGTPKRVVKITNTKSVCSNDSKTSKNTSETVKLGVLDHVSAPLLVSERKLLKFCSLLGVMNLQLTPLFEEATHSR